MKIKDLSKIDKDENPLEIETEGFMVKRYTKIDEKYYESSEKITRANGVETDGTILQNDGVILAEDVEENTARNFEPVSQSDDGVNYYIISHPDGVSADGRFANMKRRDIKAVKGDINIINPTEDANHKDMIKSKLGGFGSDQDKNNDKLSADSLVSMAKNAALSAVNIGGIATKIQEVVEKVKGDYAENSFDNANQKIISWKEDNYKQIHSHDYKESQYYNDYTNITDAKFKTHRGDLMKDLPPSSLGELAVAMLNSAFDFTGLARDDWSDTSEELAALNLAGEYNMYIAKPGTHPKTKKLENSKPYPTVLEDPNANVGSYRDSRFKDEQDRYGADTGEIYALPNDHQLKRSVNNPFSPKKLSDAQARFLAILKYKNSYLQTIGQIYVTPFYNIRGFDCNSIPFEFRPEISEGGMTAKYQAEALLNRIGDMMVYTGTSISTLTLTTTYIALAPQRPNIDEMSSQFNVNAWEYYWTPDRIDAIEWQLRSLVLPVINDGSNSNFLKPPIVQIMLGGKDEIPTVGTLYKYPATSSDSLRSYIRISDNNGKQFWKKYVVTSVQIDKLDQDILSYPSLYGYSSTRREGQEDDGIAANVYPLDKNGNLQGVNSTTSSSVDSNGTPQSGENENNEQTPANLGFPELRRRGFKATLQLTEVTENFLDIVPDYAAYVKAATVLLSSANKTSEGALSAMGAKIDGQSIMDALTADANDLAASSGSLEESVKANLEKAYMAAKHYFVADKDICAKNAALVCLAGVFRNNEDNNTALKNAARDWKNDTSFSISSVVKFAEEFSYDSIDVYKIKTKGALSISIEDKKLTASIKYPPDPNSSDTLATASFSILGSLLGGSKKEDETFNEYVFKDDNPLKIEINLPNNPIEVPKPDRCLRYLQGEIAKEYFDNYFNAYYTLKKALTDKNKTNCPKQYQYIEELVKCFENGDKLFAYSKLGLKKEFGNNLPSIDTIISMWNNTFSSVLSIYNEVNSEVKNVTGQEFPLTAKSVSITKNGDGNISAVVGDNPAIEMNSDNDVAAASNFITKVFNKLSNDDKNFSWLISIDNYNQESLKNRYEKIMKSDGSVPHTPLLEDQKNGFNKNYIKENTSNYTFEGVEPFETFLTLEYDGDASKNITGLKDIAPAEESALADFDKKLSVVYLANKRKRVENDLNGVENAKKQAGENLEDAGEGS